MKKNNFITLIILTGVICFVLGYFTGKLSQPNKVPSGNSIIQSTKQAIKNRLLRGKIIWPEPKEIYSLSGTVKKTGDNYLIVTPAISQDPMGDIFPDEVKIQVANNTKIEKWTGMTGKEYEKLIEPYKNKKCEPGKCKLPEPFYKKTAKLSDIKPGYYIQEAKSDTNIRGQKSFVAESIAFSSENPFSR